MIFMTEHELELLSIIREHKHPDKAMEIAVNVICWFLKQPESSAAPSVVDSRELA